MMSTNVKSNVKIEEIIQQTLEGIEFLKNKKGFKKLRFSDKIRELEKIIREFIHTSDLNTLNQALHFHRSSNIAVPEGEDAFETTIWNTELHVKGKATTLEYIFNDLEDEFRKEYDKL